MKVENCRKAASHLDSEVLEGVCFDHNRFFSSIHSVIGPACVARDKL